MAIRSGFFNSVNGDKKYDARRFAEYFASFIGNGVFPNPSDNLQIIANNDMTVTVKAGKTWINGYIMINDDDYILEIATADGVLNRIDRVVARYDTVDREIRLEVKKGTFASNPTAPELQRDVDAYELALADVYVAAGSISISQADITDLRLNSELCGIVHGTVEQVDTTTLFNQYMDWYTNVTGQAEADINAIKQQFQSDINQFLQDWQDWYPQTTQQAETDINSIIQQFQDNLTQFNQDWDEWFSQQQTEGFVMAVEKGQPNGIATLDENGKVPDEQLPEIEVPVTSVNGKTGDVKLTATDVGAETPDGAQSKADEAEQNAKDYADNIKPTKVSQLENDVGYITSQREVSDSVSSTSSSVAASSKAVKTAYDKANDAYAKITSATYVRDKVKEADGSGSGIDADTLDGKHASDFALSSHSHTETGVWNESSGIEISEGGSYIKTFYLDFTPKSAIILGHGVKSIYGYSDSNPQGVVGLVTQSGFVRFEQSSDSRSNSRFTHDAVYLSSYDSEGNFGDSVMLYDASLSGNTLKLYFRNTDEEYPRTLYIPKLLFVAFS